MKEEGSGRARQIRCWKMDLESGQISEYKSGDQLFPTFSNDPEFVPTISVTAPDKEMVKIITQKLDMQVAEVFGKCQLKCDARITRDLTSVLTQINSVQPAGW